MKLFFIFLFFVLVVGVDFGDKSCTQTFRFRKICRLYRYTDTCTPGDEVRNCKPFKTTFNNARCPVFVCRSRSQETTPPNGIVLKSNKNDDLEEPKPIAVKFEKRDHHFRPLPVPVVTDEKESSVTSSKVVTPFSTEVSSHSVTSSDTTKVIELSTSPRLFSSVTISTTTFTSSSLVSVTPSPTSSTTPLRSSSSLSVTISPTPVTLIIDTPLRSSSSLSVTISPTPVTSSSFVNLSPSVTKLPVPLALTTTSYVPLKPSVTSPDKVILLPSTTLSTTGQPQTSSVTLSSEAVTSPSVSLIPSTTVRPQRRRKTTPKRKSTTLKRKKSTQNLERFVSSSSVTTSLTSTSSIPSSSVTTSLTSTSSTPLSSETTSFLAPSSTSQSLTSSATRPSTSSSLTTSFSTPLSSLSLRSLEASSSLTTSWPLTLSLSSSVTTTLPLITTSSTTSSSVTTSKSNDPSLSVTELSTATSSVVTAPSTSSVVTAPSTSSVVTVPAPSTSSVVTAPSTSSVVTGPSKIRSSSVTNSKSSLVTLPSISVTSLSEVPRSSVEKKEEKFVLQANPQPFDSTPLTSLEKLPVTSSGQSQFVEDLPQSSELIQSGLDQNFNTNISRQFNMAEIDCPTETCFATHFFAQVCKVYIGSPPNCDVPCKLNGCQVEIHHDIICTQYVCHEHRTTTPNATTARPYSPSENGLIASATFNGAFLIVLGLIILRLFKMRRNRRNARQRYEDEAENTPIIRSSAARLLQPSAPDSSLMHSDEDLLRDVEAGRVQLSTTRPNLFACFRKGNNDTEEQETQL